MNKSHQCQQNLPICGKPEKKHFLIAEILKLPFKLSVSEANMHVCVMWILLLLLEVKSTYRYK